MMRPLPIPGKNSHVVMPTGVAEGLCPVLPPMPDSPLLHIDAIDSPVTSGSTITALNDLSGNGYHHTDDYYGGFPSVGSVNGKQSISFTGLQSLLIPGVKANNPVPIGSSGITLAAVVRVTGDTSIPFVYNIGADWGRGIGLFVRPNVLFGGVCQNAGGVGLTYSGAMSGVRLCLLSFVCEGQSDLYLDDFSTPVPVSVTGSSQTANTLTSAELEGQVDVDWPPSSGGGPSCIGSQANNFQTGSRHFLGDLFELLYYDRPLDANERVALQTYLGARWL